MQEFFEPWRAWLWREPWMVYQAVISNSHKLRAPPVHPGWGALDSGTLQIVLDAILHNECAQPVVATSARDADAEWSSALPLLWWVRVVRGCPWGCPGLWGTGGCQAKFIFLYTFTPGSMRLCDCCWCHGERQRALCPDAAGEAAIWDSIWDLEKVGHVHGTCFRSAATLRFGRRRLRLRELCGCDVSRWTCAGRAVGCSPLEGRRGTSNCSRLTGFQVFVFPWSRIWSTRHHSSVTCKGLEWDGPLNPSCGAGVTRPRQQQQVGSLSHRASLPPLVHLRPAQHIAAIAGWMSQSDWELHMATDNFESGGEDWPDAYRHSPISGREESYGCAVAWWHHERQQPAFQLYNSLRLQSRASDAIPGLWKPWEGACLLAWCLCSLTMRIWWTGPVLKEHPKHPFASSTTFSAPPFAVEKHQPMSAKGLFLGLEHTSPSFLLLEQSAFGLASAS